MSKRNVAYIKPQEPSFLTELKQQVGYKEGPTVDTKREALPAYNDDDFEDEDLPVVVVLKPGDLTAEEADNIKKQEEQSPANLDERVVFRKPNKDKRDVKVDDNSKSGSCSSDAKKRQNTEEASVSKKLKKSKDSKSSSSSKRSTNLLSFNAEDEDES